VTRREHVEDFVTRATSQTTMEVLTQAREGRLGTGLSSDETIVILVRSAQALYQVECWLADELDKIEATVAAR
jgi:hypothetical protein